MTGWTGSLLLGVALDFAVGDPVFRLHPVRLIGDAAAAAEKLLRPRLPPYPAGVLAWTATVAAAAGIGWALMALSRAVFGIQGEIAVGGILVWASIAARDLASHALRVRDSLRKGDLPEARTMVGMIVGRETARLDSAGVARAAVESVAESFVDGVAAPLFWAALLGPLGAVAYRAANTMDSMFGHKNERYLRFGRFPAKADDAATWVPARLAGFLACMAAPAVGGSPKWALGVFLSDRLKHESPNSAHGEAAFAGALGVALGGPTVYAEGVADKPWLGSGGRGDCGQADIARAVRLMVVSTLAWTALAGASAWALGLIFG